MSIAKASTFRGFFDKHDKIYSPIEKDRYVGSNEQLFLRSYRSFAQLNKRVCEKYAFTINLTGIDLSKEQLSQMNTEKYESRKTVLNNCLKNLANWITLSWNHLIHFQLRVLHGLRNILELMMYNK